MLRSLCLASLLAAPCASQTFSQVFSGQSPQDVLVEPNGDVIVLEWSSILVLRADGSLRLRLETPETILRSICRTSDGGHAVTGYSAQGALPYCARFDANWDLSWDLALPSFDIYGGRLEAVFELPGGDLRAVGYAPFYSGSYFAIGRPLHLQVDQAGVLQQLKTSDLAFVFDAAMLSDGSYFSVGFATNGYGSVPTTGETVLQLWGADGQLLSSTWATPGVDLPRQVVVTPDGGCLVLGDRVLRFDAQGDVVWRREYGAGEDRPTLMQSLSLTPDGGVLMAGSVWIEERWHGRLVKLDANDDVEWDRAYGDADGSKSFAAAAPHAGGHVAVGSDASGAAERVWVVRVDADGLLPGCVSIPLSSSVVDIAVGDEALAVSDDTDRRLRAAWGRAFRPRPSRPSRCASRPTSGPATAPPR